jgi:LacI family transcriptional regulator
MIILNSIEIAKLAGVSRSTVSRVINNYPNVPEDTKKKVMDIITKYNYVPHASARMLAGKHNKILGLVIIDTKEGHDKVYSSTYFSLFTSLIIDYAKEMGYNVLVSIVSKNGDFKNVKDIFYNKTVCAGIFIGAKNNDENLKDIINNCNYVSIIGQEPNATDEFSLIQIIFLVHMSLLDILLVLVIKILLTYAEI